MVTATVAKLRTDPAIGKAREKALSQLAQALPHIEAAMDTIATATGTDPDDWLDGLPEEFWQANHLARNLWCAHLHVSDPEGS